MGEREFAVTRVSDAQCGANTLRKSVQYSSGFGRCPFQFQENVSQIVVKGTACENLVRTRIQGLLDDVALDMGRKADETQRVRSSRRISTADKLDELQSGLGRFQIENEAFEIGRVGQPRLKHVE